MDKRITVLSFDVRKEVTADNQFATHFGDTSALKIGTDVPPVLGVTFFTLFVV